jgi:hypothetical protein
MSLNPLPHCNPAVFCNSSQPLTSPRDIPCFSPPFHLPHVSPLLPLRRYTEFSRSQLPSWAELKTREIVSAKEQLRIQETVAPVAASSALKAPATLLEAEEAKVTKEAREEEGATTQTVAPQFEAAFIGVQVAAVLVAVVAIGVVAKTLCEQSSTNVRRR